MAAAITPSNKVNLSLGNRAGIGASFLSITNGDWWVTGLGTIEGIVITDSTAGNTFGATYASGGVVTFATSGALSNVRVLAIGLP